LNNLTAWLGVLAAVLTLISAALGIATYRTGIARDEAESRAETLAKEIESGETRLENLNEQLKRAEKTLRDAGLTPLPDPNAGAGAELRRGLATLSSGYCIDLDTALPNWRVSGDCGSIGGINSEGDLRNDGLNGGLGGINGVDYAILEPSATGSFSTCQAATNYDSWPGSRATPRGTVACVRTTSGNLALIRFDHVREEPFFSSVTLSIVVWKAH
jgi:hypothetical protein